MTSRYFDLNIQRVLEHWTVSEAGFAPAIAEAGAHLTGKVALPTGDCHWPQLQMALGQLNETTRESSRVMWCSSLVGDVRQRVRLRREASSTSSFSS